ncbi:PrsW family glutamic-type intramembrane protease [Mariprofundus sp. KV]|uniref:PrsW family glutamic-type intramembrane protease n=1 Tax=Mariprofundus sp. KV TaxID=2608715 RepID=UPI0015A1225F|nr:PrsW family glutamic-type intramembrane protease [Mariprofundus sp. KV]NWF35888.1 PrsW family intramembrane metalloprotease [Mariprofundus sp. KV]
MLMVFFTVAAALLPSITLLRWFRNSDQFPEPWTVVRRVFWRGVWVILPVVVVAQFLEVLQPEDPFYGALFEAFMLAAIPEELFKYIVLVMFCLRLKEFDEPMDGIVYGVTVSLGFATLENILYVMDGGLTVAIMRAFTSVPVHAMMGAIMGYFIAMTLIEPENRNRNYLLAFLVPMMLHGLYDFPLMYFSATGDVAEPDDNTGFMIMIWFVTFFLMWRMAVVYTKRLQLHQQNL